MLLLCGGSSTAQHPRDSWKLKPFDLESHLSHSLTDAPLSRSEREQIYSVLDSVGDAETILSFQFGSIALANDGSQQILVRGTGPFCGATGNCSMWILVRKAGQLRLGLRTLGQLLIVRNSFTQGFRDIAVGLHNSAFIEQYTQYRWDGSAYSQTDCYSTEYPSDGNRHQRPAIVGCR